MHHLLLGALLDPQALGIPHLEDQSCRAMALLAKVRRPFTPHYLFMLKLLDCTPSLGELILYHTLSRPSIRNIGDAEAVTIGCLANRHVCTQGVLEAAAKSNSAALHSFKAALALRLQELPLVNGHGQVR